MQAEQSRVQTTNCNFTSLEAGPTFSLQGQLVAEDCSFSSGEDGRTILVRGLLRLTNCIIEGDVLGDLCAMQILDCTFFLAEESEMPTISGSILGNSFFHNSIIEGTLSASSRNTIPIDISECTFSGDLLLANINTILLNSTVGIDSLGNVTLEGRSIQVEGNEILNKLDIESEISLSVTNNRMLSGDFQSARCELSNNTIEMECKVRGRRQNLSENRLYGTVEIDDAERVVLEKNLITARIEIDNAPTEFRQNTIITPLIGGLGAQFESIGVSGESDIVFSSNIVIGRYAALLFDVHSYDRIQQEFTISYNCLFGMSNIFSPRRTSPDPEEVVEPNNIYIDPFLQETDPLNPSLQPISPCIDTGDPDLHDDPDGTRADMGAYFFDQRFDHRPGIHSPELVYAQRDAEFTYIVRGSDEEALDLRIEDLPDWLRPLGRDFEAVEDSLILQGMVPENQEDFSFRIFAEDEAGNQDSLTVMVRAIDLNPISGWLSGRLRREDSPFYITDNITISLDDTLIIEPGCEFLIKGIYGRVLEQISMDVLGTLVLRGTEEDSIKFRIESDGDDPGQWRGLFFYTPNTDQVVEYLRFDDANRALRAYFLNSFTMQHCTFYRQEGDVPDCIRADNVQNLIVRNNVFWDGIYANKVSSTLIADNKFNNNSSANLFIGNNAIIERNVFSSERTVHLDVNAVDTVLISRCVFDSSHGTGVGLLDTKEAEIEHCTFYNNQLGIRYAEGPVHINNCTFNGENDWVIGYTSIGLDTLLVEYTNFLGFDSIFFNGIEEFPAQLGEGCLNVDPEFVDPSNGNFWLAEGSPLIDAGNPGGPLDPDSTRGDLGAFFWTPDGCTPVKNEITNIGNPEITYSLYPNPCNSLLRISYSLAQTGTAHLRIFEISGREVRDIMVPNTSAGIKTDLCISTDELASGVYFVSLKSKNYFRTSRILVLK